MAKITEKVIIEFLQKKLQRLQKEVKKTEIALEALLEIKQEKPEAAKKERKVAKATKAILKKGDLRTKPVSKNGDTPASYNADSPLYDKITFAISRTGPAFKEDIVQCILEQEPEADHQKLMNAVTSRLSLLYKKGRIGARKEGRKFKYELMDS